MKNYALNKLYRIFFMAVLWSSLASGVSAQSAREHYAQAKKAFEDGEISACMSSLGSCESQLGGSNARIEAMKAQCYVQNDDWVKAKIAFRNYLNMLSYSDHSGESWEQMSELGKEIDAGLRSADEAFKQKIIDEKAANLKAVEAKISQNVTAKQARAENANQKNGDRLYSYAVNTRDVNALNLYKEVAAASGSSERVKKVNEEVDKHKNPNKYLLEAVLAKNTVEARYLIGLGGDKDHFDANGNSLLHLTVNTGDDNMQRMLKEKGADLEARNSNDETPLMFALKKGKYAMFSTLLGLGANAKAATKNGASALHYALRYTKEVAATERLLQKGADFNKVLSKNDTIMSPLYYAVYYRQSAPLVQTLLTAGAPVDEGKQGWSPLMAAVLIHDADLVTKLISNKANVNLTGIHSWTALHFAGRENQPKLVETLLKAGANLKMKDEWGRTARNVARENEAKEALAALK